MNDTTANHIDFNKLETPDREGRPRYNVIFDGKYIGRVERDCDGDWASCTAAGTVAWDDTRIAAAVEMVNVWRRFTGDSADRFHLWSDATHAFLSNDQSDRGRELRRSLRKEYRHHRRGRSAINAINSALSWIDGSSDAAAYLRSAVALVESGNF